VTIGRGPRGDKTVSENDEKGERFAWAGPAVFTVVALAIVAFFWWFL